MHARVPCLTAVRLSDEVAFMPEDDIVPRRIAILLVPGFALMSYATLIEGFRAANALSGRTLYAWHHISPDGAVAQASSGARMLVDGAVGDAIVADRLFVLAGGSDPGAFRDRATLAWLRRQARGGTVIAGVSGGPYVLARAGLLAGRRATIHWEHMAAFAADFPDVALESGLYVIDGRMITCAGGTAALDLATALIEADHGAALARRVSDWFIRTTPREAAAPQRQGLAERYGTTAGPVLRALALIEAAPDRPMPRAALARAAGLSLRQLDRLFHRELGFSLAECAMAIRLDAAAHRLRTTDLAVTTVALECGFASAAHFSRRFARRFGHAPSAQRKSF
jgi:transcriptional regulator GlxA family with amidase domain